MIPKNISKVKSGGLNYLWLKNILTPLILLSMCNSLPLPSSNTSVAQEAIGGVGGGRSGDF